MTQVDSIVDENSAEESPPEADTLISSNGIGDGDEKPLQASSQEVNGHVISLEGVAEKMANSPRGISGKTDGTPRELSEKVATSPREVTEKSVASPRGVTETPVTSPRGVGEKAVASPREVTETPVTSPRGVAEKAVASPREVTETAVASPREVTEKAVASPRGVTKTPVTSPREVTEKVVASPRGVTETAVASPREVAEAAVTSPRGVTEKSVASPRGVAENAVSSPRGVTEKPVASPRGISETAIASPMEVLEKMATTPRQDPEEIEASEEFSGVMATTLLDKMATLLDAPWEMATLEEVPEKVETSEEISENVGSLEEVPGIEITADEAPGGPAGDSKGPVSQITREKKYFRSKIPSPRASPRYKATVRSVNVFENGDTSGKPTQVLLDFAELNEWDDALTELYQGMDFRDEIKKVFTVAGKAVKDLETLKCQTDIVVTSGGPFKVGTYKTVTWEPSAEFIAGMSKSVQLRPSTSPQVGPRTPRSARYSYTKSAMFDEDIFAREAPEGNALTKTFSEQNVHCNGNKALGRGQSANPTTRQCYTARPRPVSCYTARNTPFFTAETKNSTHVVTSSKIPLRILPNITSDPKALTYNVTNPSIELTAHAIKNAANYPSPPRSSNPNSPRPVSYPWRPNIDMSASLPILNQKAKPARERLSRQEMMARREFVRPRLVTIIRSGLKPRNCSRYLLNQRTAKTFEQVLSDITGSVKPDWGAIRRVYALSGTEVTTLEDFFKEERIFVVCPNDRVGPDDFQLEDAEIKAIQPWVKIPPTAAKGKTVDSRSPRRRPRPSPRSTHIRTPPLVYPTHPKFIPINEYPRLITDKYDVGDVIGDGNFAVVRQCTQRPGDTKYALKVIDKTKSGRDAPPDHEVTILKSVKHPNIILLYEQFDYATELYVIMEYIPGGDLFDTISQNTKFSEQESASMTKDIASALSFLHSRGIVHRDVKPENLLVYEEDDGQKRLKLGDFGLAQFTGGGSPLYTICGTPTYVAPEILSESGYGVKVDVWATGIILYILLCGYPPFISPTGEQEGLFDLILVGDYEFPAEQWDTISEDAKDLIMRMIESDVDLRLEADEVLEHPWLANNDEETEEKRNRFFRKDFKFSVFEQMGLTKLSNNLATQFEQASDLFGSNSSTSS